MTEVESEQRGYDGGKKLAGRKRHIVIVDILGLILAVVVQGTVRHAYEGAILGLLVLWAKLNKLKRKGDLCRLGVRPRRAV